MTMVTRHQCRFAQPCVPATFTQALSCRVLHGPLKVETICERAQVRRDRLYAWCSDNQPDQPPLDCFLRLCAVLGWDLLDYALQAHGRITMALPTADDAERDVFAEAADVTVAASEVLKRARAATTDRDIDLNEERRILQALGKLETETAELRSALGARSAR